MDWLIKGLISRVTRAKNLHFCGGSIVLRHILSLVRKSCQLLMVFCCEGSECADNRIAIVLWIDLATGVMLMQCYANARERVRICPEF